MMLPPLLCVLPSIPNPWVFISLWDEKLGSTTGKPDSSGQLVPRPSSPLHRTDALLRWGSQPTMVPCVADRKQPRPAHGCRLSESLHRDVFIRMVGAHFANFGTTGAS